MFFLRSFSIIIIFSGESPSEIQEQSNIELENLEERMKLDDNLPSDYNETNLIGLDASEELDLEKLS